MLNKDTALFLVQLKSWLRSTGVVEATTVLGELRRALEVIGDEPERLFTLDEAQLIELMNTSAAEESQAVAMLMDEAFRQILVELLGGKSVAYQLYILARLRELLSLLLQTENLDMTLVPEAFRQSQAVAAGLRAVIDKLAGDVVPATAAPEAIPASPYLDLTGGELLTLISPADPENVAKHADRSWTLRWAPPMRGMDPVLIRSLEGVTVIKDEHPLDYLEGWTAMQIGVTKLVKAPEG